MRKHFAKMYRLGHQVWLEPHTGGEEVGKDRVNIPVDAIAARLFRLSASDRACPWVDREVDPGLMSQYAKMLAVDLSEILKTIGDSRCETPIHSFTKSGRAD